MLVSYAKNPERMTVGETGHLTEVSHECGPTCLVMRREPGWEGGWNNVHYRNEGRATVTCEYGECSDRVRVRRARVSGPRVSGPRVSGRGDSSDEMGSCIA